MPSTPAYVIRALVQLPAAQLQVQLLDNTSGKATKDSPNIWALATHTGDPVLAPAWPSSDHPAPSGE